MVIHLPQRYDNAVSLGQGGGGCVWSVRDRLTGDKVLLKALRDDATEQQAQALVREAIALSGLEGLNLPKVLRFGCMPGSRSRYMVRELVDGQSLDQALSVCRAKDAGEGQVDGVCRAKDAGEGQEDDVSPRVLLRCIVDVAHLLTRLHRVGLLHGDVKPANIIVSPQGCGTLVDLGLAAPWREAGTRPKGLTPAYAAPELLAGHDITVRAEIFALGATLRDVLSALQSALDADLVAQLEAIVARATHRQLSMRYPSADELASALCRAAALPLERARTSADAAWPVVGIDGASSALLNQLESLPGASVLYVLGPTGSGRSVMLRRLAWSLGVRGQDIAWVEHLERVTMQQVLEVELDLSNVRENPNQSIVLVDTQDEPLCPDVVRTLESLRANGAKLVIAAREKLAHVGHEADSFTVEPLSDDVATSLVRSVIPSLSDAIVRHVIARAHGRPGTLRAIVHAIGDEPIVRPEEVDRVLDAQDRSKTVSPVSLHAIEVLLDQGRFDEAADRMPDESEVGAFDLALCRARLRMGRGDAQGAVSTLEQVESLLEQQPAHRQRQWHLHMGRGLFRLSQGAQAVFHAQHAIGDHEAHSHDGDIATTLEALTVIGMVHSYANEHDKAQRVLADAAQQVKDCNNERVKAVVFGSLALALQRADMLQQARDAYEQALRSAELAGDAGAVANTRLNLAVIANIEGNLADAGMHLEAAIDMGQRAGRASTTCQARFNLAHLDIYLGRYARARTSLESLAQGIDTMAGNYRAQLVGLEADLAARTNDLARAFDLYQQCATKYDELGRHLDASEARLEAVLIGCWFELTELDVLAHLLKCGSEQLGASTAHRALLHLARGAIATVRGDEDRAKSAYELAISVAKEAGQKEWLWRGLEARSRLMKEMGQSLAARRDAEQALSVLEQIAAKLPRDLREVFWDDPRRRAVRTVVAVGFESSLMGAASWQSVVDADAWLPHPATSQCSYPLHNAYRAPSKHRSSHSHPSTGNVHDRLARLLEINRELACEHSLERLLDKVTEHAVSLVEAERGFVILDRQGKLVSHTAHESLSSPTDRQFSSSIAERVIATGEPVVTLSAGQDASMADYLSVHQLKVQSVACVPIRAPDNRTAGALYVETRFRPGLLFEKELPILMAFADQAAVAIENAHLIQQNRERAEQLAAAHAELERTHRSLQIALGKQTEQLVSTRRDLHATRAVLDGHFGYHGLIGTSEPMRRVFALIDRIKDLNVPVLITGDSGTGKEMVASAIHRAGSRCDRPFTGINCGAIPEHLLESELFGHVKGAFTGADRDRKGLFRESEGGTILLDEIGEMPHKMQAALLRVLQEKLVRPVGGTQELPVEARVIAATHRNLDQMVADGTFREDLYYRLRVVDLHVPALCERAHDIPILIDHFLKIFATKYQRECKTVSREAMRQLVAYPWPGNVRQLEHVLLNAWVMSDGPQLDVQDFELPTAASREARSTRFPTARSSPPPSGPGSVSHASWGENRSHAAHPFVALSKSRADFDAAEKQRILHALHDTSWNRVQAAKLCGMPRRTFYRRLEKYGIK